MLGNEVKQQFVEMPASSWHEAYTERAHMGRQPLVNCFSQRSAETLREASPPSRRGGDPSLLLPWFLEEWQCVQNRGACAEGW